MSTEILHNMKFILSHEIFLTPFISAYSNTRPKFIDYTPFSINQHLSQNAAEEKKITILFEFKESINCFSVPRCHGRLAVSFALNDHCAARESTSCPDLRDTDLKWLVIGNKLNCI